MLSLSVDDAAGLTADSNLRPALAGAISGMVGVSKNRVRIDNINAQRRLDDRIEAEARQLAQTTLRVDFTIAAETRAIADAAAAVLTQTVPSAMQSRIDASLASHGVRHTVLVYDVQYMPTAAPAPGSTPSPSPYWEAIGGAPPASGGASSDDSGMGTATIAMAAVGGVLGFLTLSSALLCLGFYVRGGSSAKTVPAKQLDLPGAQAGLDGTGFDKLSYTTSLGHADAEAAKGLPAPAGQKPCLTGVDEEKAQLGWAIEPRRQTSGNPNLMAAAHGGGQRQPSARSDASRSTTASHDWSSRSSRTSHTAGSGGSGAAVLSRNGSFDHVRRVQSGEHRHVQPSSSVRSSQQSVRRPNQPYQGR